MCPIIDSHCHVYPDKIALKAAESIGVFYDTPIACNGMVSTLLSEGEKAGITNFVICSVATTPHQVKSINNFIANTVKENPDKFTGLGTLHPDSETIKEDVEEIVSLGLKGVKLHPDFQKFAIDDKKCTEIYELCRGRLPILFHTGDKRYDYSNPERIIPVLEAYEDLTVIGAHLGGWSVWEEASEKLCGYKNIYVDCSSSLYYMDSEKATSLIRMYGADKVLFGVDYPMWYPKEELERFNKLSLTNEEKEKILYKNAAKLYNINLT